jgi:hypothetical protein
VNTKRRSFFRARRHSPRNLADARWRVAFSAILLAFLFSGGALFAQTVSIPDRLPPTAVFYLNWRGKAFLADAEKKNHVLQLLEDPGFQPVLQALATSFENSQKKNANTNSVVLLSDILSLLDNAASVGMMLKTPANGSTAPGPDSTTAGAPRHSSVFFVYDATGKTDLIQKLKKASQGGKTPPQITSYDFAGTSVEVRTDGTNVSYSARAGHYFIFADQKETIEDLIPRFAGAAQSPASVTQLPEYQAVHSYIGSDAAVEFFARIPDVDKVMPEDQKNKPAGQIVQNLHLEKIHVMGGGMSFAGEAMRIHGAVLGDTASPSLFDIVGPSSITFQTQSLLDSAPSFSMSRFSLAATYQLLRGAVTAAVTPQQAQAVNGAEMMAQGFLGMSIRDALELFTGEVASESSYSEDGTPQQLFALTIQKPQDVLRVLRATLGKKIAAEDTAGTTTYLDLSFPTTDPATGEQRRSFYYVAVAPQVILVAPRKAIVRDAIARMNANPTPAPQGSVFSNVEFVRMRALLPEKLTGLSGADMTRIPWDKVAARFVEQMQQSAKQSKQGNPPSTDRLRLIKPDVFTRHLHTSASGWWKDAGGVYFDSYVQ